MTLKERIENNLTLYTLSLLLAGFLAGIGAYKFFLDAITTTKSSTELSGQCQGELWKEPARQATWIPKAECPAYPLELKVSSPGNDTTIGLFNNQDRWLETPVVVTSNRPLPSESALGLILKPKDSQNYYTVFPYFDRVGSKNTYRLERLNGLPFALLPGMSIELQALVVDDQRKIGSVFSSLAQIREADQSVFISGSVQVKIK